MFKVGYRYKASDFLAHRPWWNNEEGYEVYEATDGSLFVLDGDGDKRDVLYLDVSSEMPPYTFTLENE